MLRVKYHLHVILSESVYGFHLRLRMRVLAVNSLLYLQAIYAMNTPLLMRQIEFCSLLHGVVSCMCMAKLCPVLLF